LLPIRKCPFFDLDQVLAITLLFIGF